jgi:hypothetical protein
MKHKPIIHVVFTLLLLVVSEATLSQSVNPCGIVNRSFASGEKLVFEISYTWLFVWTDVGMAELTVSAEKRFGRDLLHIKASGETHTFYNWFFEVHDLYETWVDPVTVEPVYFNRDIYEGGFTKENEYFYDWNKNQVAIRVRRKKGPNRYDTLSVSRCTYDVISAVYAARNLDFSGIKPGKTFPVEVLMDEEVYHIGYRFLGREEKRVSGLGRFRCLKFQIDVVAGDIFSGDQKLYLWVTDDANKLPVAVETPIQVGSIKARLTTYEGLRHPLSSKIP